MALATLEITPKSRAWKEGTCVPIFADHSLPYYKIIKLELHDKV